MKKILIGGLLAIVVLVILAVVVAGLYIDQIAKSGVEKVGPMLTKVDVRLDSVNLSLLSGGGSIKGLVVGNPEGYKSPSAIKVGSAKLALVPSTIFSDKIVIKTINVQAPQITFETDFKGNNLNKILANIDEVTGGGSQPAAGQPAKAQKKLEVDDFAITGAKMTVALTSLGGKSVTVPLPEIHLTNLGQGPEGITAASLLKQVFSELEATSVKAASAAAKDLGSEATKAAKDAATGTVDQVKKGIGGLFKK